MTNLSENIYKRLADDESKALFEARWDYYINRDLHNLEERLREVNSVYDSRTYDEYEKLNINIKKGDKAVIVGAGANGGHVYSFLTIAFKCEVVCFADNNSSKVGITYFNKPVVSVESLNQGYNDCIVIISVGDPKSREELYRQLVNIGIKPENVCLSFFNNEPFRGWDIFMENRRIQYFDLPYIVPLGDDEIFMDVGCYDGSTTKEFLKWNDNKYSEIYIFEPDPDNFIKCSDALLDLSRVKSFNAGAWSRNMELKFNAGGEMRARINFDGTTTIKVVSLDSVLQGEKATLIKMDIEGAELEALKGSEETIKKHKPRLAVSIYHKPDDIMKIPSYLLEIIPDYKFALRHYSTNQTETVLYAW